MSYLGLPPVPPDLKPITSYLQRAQETKAQDPVISYWCTYYAAQVGISLKAVSPPNREFLGALLTALENLRATVGTSDAITVENASSAYVENFALKVFASADNEDRRGTATRKTAKKFLAAATFFEILNVFEDRGPWEAHEEKVRYAKWKAADIAKALREGRQPTAGPVGGDSAEGAGEPAFALPTPPSASIDSPNTHVARELGSPQNPYQSFHSPPTSAAAFPETKTSPVEQPNFTDNRYPSLDIPPKSAPVPIQGAGTPPSAPVGPPSPPSSIGSSSSKKSRRHRVDSKVSPTAPTFSTSPQSSPSSGHRRSRAGSIGAASIISSSPTTRTQRPASPTHFVPRNSPPSTVPYLAGSPYGSVVPPPPPPSVPHTQVPPPPVPSPPQELTSVMIAKTQKHCRFAISALDYEDAEQARKELRAALAILGG